MIVQYRVYAEGGMYVCIVPCWKNEWMNELYEWMELLVMHCDLKANESKQTNNWEREWISDYKH
jgi:hypothetical protein